MLINVGLSLLSAILFAISAILIGMVRTPNLTVGFSRSPAQRSDRFAFVILASISFIGGVALNSQWFV